MNKAAEGKRNESCPTAEPRRKKGEPSKEQPRVSSEQEHAHKHSHQNIVLRPWYPVLGPCSVRFMTRATAILREIKVNYQSSFGGLAEELSYEIAIQEYCNRVKEEFPSLVGKNRAEILATVLIDKSGEQAEHLVQQSGAATSFETCAPCFEFTSGVSFIIDYFGSSDSPSVEDHVIYYRREFESARRRGLMSPSYHQFGSYLAFCEKCLIQVASGIMPVESIQDMNVVSTLGKKWREMKCLEPEFPVLLDCIEEGKDEKAAYLPLCPPSVSPRFSSNIKAATLNQAFLSACGKGDVRSAERLFCQGASIYSMDANQETAMEKAVKGNHQWILRFLLSHGANLCNVNFQGDTLMHLAAAQGHVGLLQWLHENHGPAADTPNNDGETPLHHACQGGHLLAVEWLFGASSDPFAVDADEKTAMHFAAESGHVDVVEWLVLHGFDVGAENSMKCTPLDFAVWAGHFEVSDWIENFENSHNEWIPSMKWED